MAKINWNKARKFRETEEKYEPGTELKSGRVVQPRRPDSLAARAAHAEAKWIEERAQAAKKQRQQRRKARQARKPPTNAQQRRINQIRADLGLPTD